MFLTTIFTNGLRTVKLLAGVSRLVLSSLFHCRIIWRGGYVFAEPSLEDLIMLSNLTGIERSELKLAAPTGLLSVVSVVDVV